ncbi:MAG: glycosyltransferase family 4 protein, partial [Phycisphaerales bacterium]
IQRFETISETGVDHVHNARRTSNTDDPVSLLFVGRLVRSKGVLHAIRAMARLPKDFRATLKICGTGTLAPLCEREISRLGLQGTVELLGHVPKSEVFGLYGESDIFLFPSYREPSGNVVLEGMSFGLPVITTTVGGPGYVVSDDCGIRVPPSSPSRFEAELAEAIVSLGTDRALLDRMGRAARDHVESVALWPRKIDWMCDLYDDLKRS